MRHTKTELHTLVNNLNNALNLDDINKFALDFAYGGVRLVKYTNQYGGQSDLSGRVSVSEMYEILSTIENTVYKLKLKTA